MNAISVDTKLSHYQILESIGKTDWGTLYDVIDLNQNGVHKTLEIFHHTFTNADNFLIRFELIKNLLHTVKNKNLRYYHTLEHNNNLFYWVKDTLPKGFTSLFNLETNQSKTIILKIFIKIAQAFSALQEIKSPLFRKGIPPLTVTSKNIILSIKENEVDLILDGFWDLFLFYGDQPEDFHRFFLDKNDKKEVQGFIPIEYRIKKPFNSKTLIYQWGVLLYHHLTGSFPKGIYPKVSLIHPSLSYYWTQLAEKALSGHFESIEHLLETLHQIQKKEEPKKHSLLQVHPPKGMKLVYLEKKAVLGTFEGPADQKPSFKAKISPFFIDINPITCSQYEQFNLSYKRSSYSSKNNSPATLISWHEANAYCLWRSKQEELPPNTYRLPTEYEWEAAVRGDTEEQYPWSDRDLNHYIFCERPHTEGTRPIAQTPPGRFLINDLLGNTWEWTSSFYKAHPFSKESNKKIYQQKLKVVKGGCWSTEKKECRASLRKGFSASTSRGDIGFRCVRNLDPKDL